MCPYFNTISAFLKIFFDASNRKHFELHPPSLTSYLSIQVKEIVFAKGDIEAFDS
jgi:hypothetical protein